MRAERRAEVVWEGDLAQGSGRIVSTGSGAFGDLGVSWTARTEEPDGSTSPEELIAAAHASCFSMALSNGLAQAGHAPERLDVRAVCTFEQVDGGWRITTMELDVTGRVPGMDEAAFEQAAEQAKDGCPVSKALEGNVEMTVTPKLEA
jgi:osmotically inducible protein OsmC